jgi:TctA family transporter
MAAQTKRATTVANTRAVFMLDSEVHTLAEVSTAFIPATYVTVCVLALPCARCGSTEGTCVFF